MAMQEMSVALQAVDSPLQLAVATVSNSIKKKLFIYLESVILRNFGLAI